jgi:biopolymer transport protein ExbD
MKIRRRGKLLVDVPAVATGDIAFNLIVFFLICAAPKPEGGRTLEFPRSDEETQQTQDQKNIEVLLTRNARTVTLNEQTYTLEEFERRVPELIKQRPPAQRTVFIKREGDVQWQDEDRVIFFVKDAGGTPVLEIEETEERVAGK